MPAILAGLGILIQQVFEWAVTGAIIGGLLGGGTGAMIEVVTGVQDRASKEPAPEPDQRDLRGSAAARLDRDSGGVVQQLRTLLAAAEY